MASRSKAKVVDTFATLHATRLHARAPRYSTRTDTPEEKSESKPSGAPERKPGIQAGRTVMPTTYEIVCYSCGYGFVIRGRAKTTQCPKCGARLGLTDETITGAYTEELITAGRVHLKPTAILEGGKITANDVVLEGTVKSGFVHAYKTLELAKRAKIPEDLFEARSLRIGPGAKFAFNKKLNLRNLELQGELHADVTADGMVSIHAGGFFKGTLEAEHLSVEEGGGLRGDISVRSAATETETVKPESGDATPGETPPKDKTPTSLQDAPPVIRPL